MRYQYFLILAAATMPLLATSVPRVTLEEAISKSELVIQGEVGRSWAAWDANHRYIWTHTEITIRDRWKGSAGPAVVVSEPGGQLDGVGQAVVGVVTYTPGERVVLFLYKTPIGYWRTVGWGQGKLRLDAQNHLHAVETGAEILDLRKPSTVTKTPLSTLENTGMEKLRERVRAQGGSR